MKPFEHELELHALHVQKLQGTSKEEIYQKRLRDLIRSYEDGELSAEDLRSFTNIDPDQIVAIVKELGTGT